MTGHGQNAPAGWYPMDGGLQRYWNGSQWTEHIIGAPNPSQAQAPQPSHGPQQIPPPGSPYGQGPQPGQTYGQAPQPAPGQGASGFVGGQAPFAQAQPGWQGSGWQDPGAAQYGHGHQPMVDGTYPMYVSAADRSSATVAHILGLFFGFLGPLIIYLTKKDESVYVAEQSREALNFQLSLFLYWIGSLFALIILVGFVLIPILIVVQIILPIVAAVATNKGERYRYPLTLRMIT